MKWEKRTLLQIDIAGVFVCVAVSLVAYFTELKPLIERRFFLVNQRLNLAAQREESSELGASMRSLDNQLTVVREKLAKDKIKLESSDQINQRIAELTALFNDSALEVDDVQTGRISIGSKCDLVPISVAGRGGYKQYATFLDKLHETFADISVARFELQGKPENPASAHSGGMFGIQLFWHTAHKI